jgi:hypothetical protein
MTGWTSERPGQAVYRQTHANIGKYGGALGRPYIEPDVPIFVPHDGENCVRIVDPIELLELQCYYFDVFFHRNVGFRNDYFLCLRRHNITECPICASSSGELWDTNKDAAKALLPDNRRLMWVLDLKNPAEANILKLWSAPRTLADEILAQSRDPEMDVIIEVSDPTTGVPVYFNRTGKGMLTKYSGVKLGQRPMPLGEDIAAQRFRFMDILIVPSPEEVEASFNMTETAPEVGEQPAPPVGSPAQQSSYEQAQAAPPAHEIGAQEAAKIARAAETGGGEEPPESIRLLALEEMGVQKYNYDCFRRNFDEYENCDTCPDRTNCSQGWPMQPDLSQQKVPKAVKTPRRVNPTPNAPPQRVSPPDIPAQTGAAGAGAAPSPAVTNNQAQIQSAQEALRAKIAARKGQA